MNTPSVNNHPFFIALLANVSLFFLVIPVNAQQQTTRESTSLCPKCQHHHGAIV